MGDAEPHRLVALRLAGVRRYAAGYDSGVSNAADAVARLSDADRRPAGQASLHRRVTADELENEGRHAEADLLRDPGQHVVVVGNEIRPGRWSLRPLKAAVRAYFRHAGYPPSADSQPVGVDFSRNPAEQDTVFLHDEGGAYRHTVEPHLHLGPDGVPLAYLTYPDLGDTAHDEPFDLHSTRGMAAEACGNHADDFDIASGGLHEPIATAPLETVDDTHPLEVERFGHPGFKPHPRPLPPAHGT